MRPAFLIFAASLAASPVTGLGLMAAALATTAPMAVAETGMQLFSGDDPEMNAAMTAARATLPVFLDAAATADLSQGNFLVKWAHPVEGDTKFEHIWVSVFALTATEASGQLANQPVGFAGDQGDPVTVPLTNLSDWAYWAPDGKMHGSYTTRVMLPQLSAADQDYFKSILAPLPAPPLPE